MSSRNFGVLFSSALLLVLLCASLSMLGCGAVKSSSDGSSVPASVSGTVSGGSGEGIAITLVMTSEEDMSPVASCESNLALSPNFVFVNPPNGTYLIVSVIPFDGNIERPPLRYDLVGFYKASGWPYTWPPTPITYEGASISGLDFPLACYTSLEAYDSASSRRIRGFVHSSITTKEIIVGVSHTTEVSTIGENIVGEYVLPASAAGGGIYYYFFGLSDGDYLVYALQDIAAPYGSGPSTGDMVGITLEAISGNQTVPMITLEVY